MAETIDNETGEIITTGGKEIAAIDVGAMVSLARAEIDMQISTARRYPRHLTKSIARITELATLDEETAEECCYALVRKKKKNSAADEDNRAIEGPSIRLAEIAAQAWGNCRIDARVIAVNRQDKYVEAEGTFHDLETNMAHRAVVRRNIRTAAGYLFSDDMITVTGNAACAIAKRNAILAGVPRGAYRPGYKAARAIIAGTAVTLSDNRAKVYKAFAAYGVSPSQIHDLLGVGGELDVGLDHIALLRATFASIKNGEATVQEVFAREKAPEGVADPLGVKASMEKTEHVADGQRSTMSGGGAQAAATVENVTEATAQASSAEPENRKEPDDKVAKAAAKAEKKAEAASAEKAKDVASPPTTETGYIAHVEAYVEAATSASALEALWKSKPEREVRNAGVIDAGTLERLKNLVIAKVDALKASS